jgi:hypothetical protein
MIADRIFVRMPGTIIFAIFGSWSLAYLGVRWAYNKSLNTGYDLEAISALSIAVTMAIVTNVVDYRLNYWRKSGRWKRYISIIVTCVVATSLIYWLSVAMKKVASVESECPGGSPMILISATVTGYAVLGGMYTAIRSLLDYRMKGHA